MDIEDFIIKTVDVFGEDFFQTPFYLACLTEEIELFNNTSQDGVKISILMEPDEQLKYITKRFCDTAKMLLNIITLGSNFIYKGVDLAPYVLNREFYLKQLEELRQN